MFIGIKIGIPAMGHAAADSAPTVVLSSTSVAEDASIGTVVGTPSVNNLGALTVTSWAITADPDTKFDFDVSDNLITEAALDHETATSHSVTLQATLSDLSTVSRTFSISVTDVFDTAPVNSTAPSISGTATYGETLTVVPGTWDDGAATLTYQWLRDAVNISGATGSTYTLVSADVGASITVTETATNAFGANSETSAAVGPIAGVAPANTVLPAITGTAAVGETLSVSNGTWTGEPAPTFTYQWTRGGVNISGATSNTYLLVAADETTMIACIVTATNSEGSDTATAAAVGPIAEASASDLSALAVNADGWTLDATIASAVDGGTYAGLNDYATPGLALTVQSKSWDAAGVETTTSRTVIATAALRQAYPNQALRDETEVAGDLNVTLVLSDYIYSTDTITASAIASDLYTDNGTGGSGTTRGGGGPSVTNSSTRAYPKPVGMWLNHDRDWCKANSYTVRLACAHKHFKSGQMVRAVKFIATDVSLNTTSTIVTSMSKVDFTGSGLSASCFEGALDFSALAQGELVTIDAIIYPWVGDAYQVSVDGAAYPSPNLTVLKVLNDRTGAYGTVYAYVDGVGGGTPAVHETAATAATTPYSTIALAASALQTYINANFGRNNVSGGVIRLTATTHVHSTYSARAVGEIPLLIEAANAANKATTIYQDAGASTTNGIPDYLKLKDLKLRKTGGSVIFMDSTGTTTGAFALIVENCTFDINAQTVYTAWFYRLGHLYLINCDGDDCGQAGFFSTAVKQINAWGSNNGIGTAVFNAAACKALGGSWSASGTASMQTPVGSFLGWSHLGNSTASIRPVNVTREIGPDGLALVGNVIEKWGASSANPTVFISADGITVPAQNVLDIANTGAGDRFNGLYNESGIVAVAKSGISSHSVYPEWNSKSDVFATNGDLIGNWPFIYRVGSSYRVALTGDAGSIDVVGPGAWIGEIAARGDAIGTNAVPIDPDWTSDQSATGGQAGNGDYTPGVSTALPQIPAGETAFPFDQKGRSVPTDGTAHVGAIQQA